MTYVILVKEFGGDAEVEIATVANRKAADAVADALRKRTHGRSVRRGGSCRYAAVRVARLPENRTPENADAAQPATNKLRRT
jgi:hypothetical protein